MGEFPEDEFSVMKLHEHIETHFMPPPDLGIEVGQNGNRDYDGNGRKSKYAYFVTTEDDGACEWVGTVGGYNKKNKKLLL